MLWCIIGVEALLTLVRSAMLALDGTRWFGAAVYLYQHFSVAIWVVVFSYVILQAETRRWRVVFIVMAATGAVAPFFTNMIVQLSGSSISPSIPVAVQFVRHLTTTTTAAAAAWLDLRQPHYPWTHWTGFVLLLLQLAATTWSLVTILLLWNLA